jgi:hypothetical protein
MANHASHAALPWPVKNARYTVAVPYLDADGDPTDPTTPDTEVSKDNGAFADTTEEVSIASGSRGAGMHTLTGAETDCSLLVVWFGAASGPKATVMTLYPRVLPVLESGTAQAGAAGTITLAAGAAAYDLTGCIVRTTGGTGGGGTGGANNQARVILAYNPSTKVASVAPWETNPSSDTTYEIHLTEMAVNALVTRALRPTTDGRTLDVSSGGEAGLDWANVGSPTTTVTLSGTTVKTATDVETDTQDLQSRLPAALVSGRMDASVGAMAAGTITAAAIATGAIDADALAADAVTALRALASGTADSGTTTTLVDSARTEADTDWWKGDWLLFTSGTLSGQCRLITGFTPASDTLTFAPPTTQAVDTHTYEILPAAAVNVRQWLESTVNALLSGRVDVDVQAMANDVITAAVIATAAVDADAIADNAIDAGALAAGAITAATFAAGAIDASALAADAIGASELATSAVTEIRDAILSDSTPFAGANIDAAVSTRATPAQVNTEVLDVLNTDTFAEPGQAAPPATSSLVSKISYLYKFLRNRVTVTGTTIAVYNDDGTTVGHKSTHSDDGTTYDRGEYVSGP